MLQTLASCFIFLNVLMLFQPHCWVSRILEIDTDLKIWALGDTGLIFQQLGGLIFQFNTEPFICRVLPPPRSFNNDNKNNSTGTEFQPESSLWAASWRKCVPQRPDCGLVDIKPQGHTCPEKGRETLAPPCGCGFSGYMNTVEFCSANIWERATS